MRVRNYLSLPLFVLLGAVPSAAQPAKQAPAEKPLLRLEAAGPTSNVTALAFSPNGKFLYAAGHDKVVRVWALNGAGKFVLQDETSYRVPIGPGQFGAVNTLAISDDGGLLAVGGFNATKGSLLFEDVGGVIPSVALTEDDRKDIGLVYVFDTKQRRLLQTLRGHTGEVRNLTFVERGKGRLPTLVSAARVPGKQNTST